MKRIIFLVIMISVIANISYSQNKADTSDFEYNPQFRSV